MSNGTPQARELARTTLIAYPGWQDRFDRKLSEAVEFWKAHQEKRLVRDFLGQNVEVLADGRGAGDARFTAELTFHTLASIKHPSVISIIAKHLDADGDTYSSGDSDFHPLNWHAAGALAELVSAGVSIPGAPRVNKNLVVDEWKEWWRTHRQFYEAAAAPAPTPNPPAESTVPSATPAPPQAKLDEPIPPPTAIKPAPAESGWSAAMLAAIAGLALIAALVVLGVFMRGRKKR